MIKIKSEKKKMKIKINENVYNHHINDLIITAKINYSSYFNTSRRIMILFYFRKQFDI